MMLQFLLFGLFFFSWVVLAPSFKDNKGFGIWAASGSALPTTEHSLKENNNTLVIFSFLDSSRSVCVWHKELEWLV